MIVKTNMEQFVVRAYDGKGMLEKRLEVCPRQMGTTQNAIEALKLPDHIVPLCAIIIGHPAENPEPKDKWLPENVSYNEFGGQAE